MKKILSSIIIALSFLALNGCEKDYLFHKSTMQENLCRAGWDWYGNGVVMNFFNDETFYFKNSNYYFHGKYKIESGDKISFTPEQDRFKTYSITNAQYFLQENHYPQIKAHFKCINHYVTGDSIDEFDYTVQMADWLK